MAIIKIAWGTVIKKARISKTAAIKSKILPMSGRKGIAFTSKIDENKIITPLGKSIPVITDNSKKATNKSNNPNIFTIDQLFLKNVLSIQPASS